MSKISTQYYPFLETITRWQITGFKGCQNPGGFTGKYCPSVKFSAFGGDPLNFNKTNKINSLYPF
jgi:hypothetical protein